jgi:antirestriction protein ArdC
MQNRDDIYTRVTNQIIAAIEAGTKNFRMPWHITEADCFAPINAVSKRPYRGVNVLILWATAQSRGYAGGLWATYEQWKQLGAQVRKGEKATTVVLWKPTEPKSKKADDQSEQEDKKRRGLLARGYSVFNLAQVDGYQHSRTPKLFENIRIRAAEKVLLGAGADVRHGGSEAYYHKATDFIAIPHFEDFRDSVGYYSVLAHELTHWTAAPHRLNRDLSGRFGSEAYAAEELVAELGAAFLCGALGLSVEPREDHAGYIANWLAILRSDKKAIFSAASKAQQAADWIISQTAQPLPTASDSVAA